MSVQIPPYRAADYRTLRLMFRKGVVFKPWTDEVGVTWPQLYLNLNDTWYWASADGEVISPEDIEGLCRFYREWGYAGVLRWVRIYRRNHDPEIPQTKALMDACC